MAATGKTPILLYGSTTPTNAPTAGNLTNSTDGCEIAINVADKNLFFKDSTNVVNTVPIRQSSASSNGWLSSTDWNTFNNKQPAGTYVTSVTGTAPVVSSGGTTPAISMAAANGSTNGYLTSTDWSTFNNKVSSQWTTSGSTIYYNTGNVGVGTTPAFKLDVSGPTGDGIRYTGGSISTVMGCSASAVQIGSISSTDVSILVGAAEKVRFFTSGGVSIGNTTDPGAANLSVNSKCIVSGTAITNIGGSSLNHEVYSNGNGTIGGYQLGAGGYVYNSYAVSNGGTYYHFYFSDAGTSHGSITSNGTNTTCATSSDSRLKENIVDAKSALPLINSVKIRSFDWIGKEKSQDFGVIAQELIDICPDAVVKGITEEDTWGVDTSFLIPAAIKALQELQIKIEQLETEISTLKGK